MAQITTFGHTTQPRVRNYWAFWWQWVAANAVAETVGLGLSALLWIAFLFDLEQRLGVLVSAVVVVLGSTLFEGGAVGLAQWFILRRRLPQLQWQHWLIATALGALVAWMLGMIPSTMMSMNEAATAEPPPVMSDALMYGLAAVMGIVLGPVLGLPQWWVLRRHVAHAVWWIPAQSAAWALGMIAIFIGVGLIPPGALSAATIFIVLASLATAGALVGAVHGAVLVWLLRAVRIAQ